MSEHPKRRSTDHGWRWIIRKAYHDVWLLAITVVLFLIAAKAFDTSQQAAKNERRTHAALCTLRGDLQQRVDASNTFLAEHPKGILGISAATIRQSTAGQQRTIDALSGLACRTHSS